MSLIRVLLGVAVGTCLLLLGFAAVWYFALPMWLPPVILLTGASIFQSIGSEARRRALLQPYWSRGCTGTRWRRRYPVASKHEIRAFLAFFVGAFGFPQRRRFCFSPDDKILEVYRAAYPPGDALGDCLDLESFADDIQKHYHVDPASVWRDDLTLGELFQQFVERNELIERHPTPPSF